MTEFHPIYQIYFMTPMALSSRCEELPVTDRRLLWTAKPSVEVVGYYHYTCLSALAVEGREEDCQTPPFRPILMGSKHYVPDYVIDWMHGFAKVMQIGAAYQRQMK